MHKVHIVVSLSSIVGRGVYRLIRVTKSEQTGSAYEYGTRVLTCSVRLGIACTGPRVSCKIGTSRFRTRVGDSDWGITEKLPDSLCWDGFGI